MSESKNSIRTIRTQGRVTTVETVTTGFGDRTTSWSLTDGLDKKSLSSAKDNYEKAFVLIRESLETNESYCLDNEKERLQCCQDIVDVLRGNQLFKRTFSNDEG